MRPNERHPSLYRMGYNAECDGYDRKWHESYAKTRSELDTLIRGADHAARDLKAAEEAFVPKKLKT